MGRRYTVIPRQTVQSIQAARLAAQVLGVSQVHSHERARRQPIPDDLAILDALRAVERAAGLWARSLARSSISPARRRAVRDAAIRAATLIEDTFTPVRRPRQGRRR